MEHGLGDVVRQESVQSGHREGMRQLVKGKGRVVVRDG
jgi:hypothetical protein